MRKKIVCAYKNHNYHPSSLTHYMDDTYACVFIYGIINICCFFIFQKEIISNNGRMKISIELHNYRKLREVILKIYKNSSKTCVKYDCSRIEVTIDIIIRFL